MSSSDLNMDPWSVTHCQLSDTLKEPAADPDAENLSIESAGTMNFEDNFKPFEKLPDSSEYLESLEMKLRRIKRGSQSERSLSSKEMLESMKLSHESRMVHLLTDSVSNLGSSFSTEYADIKVNPILKKLAPEKQAIVVEELVHLVQADQLEILLNGSESPEDENGHNSVNSVIIEKRE